jgi:mRNA interferase MazF
VVAVASPGDFGKPRPALVVQSDLFNQTHPTLTLLPLTSGIRSAPQFRISPPPIGSIAPKSARPSVVRSSGY